MAKAERKYIKLGIPLADASVLKWLEGQDNMSDSIRQLIRQDIEKNGYDDIFCRDIVPGAKRGRPSNAELAMREQTSQKQTVETVQPAVETVVQEPVAQTQRVVQTQTVQSRQTTVPNIVQAPIPAPVPAAAPLPADDGFIDPEELLGLK